MICAMARAASSGASSTMRLLSVRRKRTPESGAVSTVTASWVTPVSEASDSMSPAHEATYEFSTSSSARLAPCGWHDRSSEYSPVCACLTRQNSRPKPSSAEVRTTLERMPGSMALPPSIGASRPERYRFAPVRCAAIHVRFSTARSTMLRCSRSLIASTRMTPMPTHEDRDGRDHARHADQQRAGQYAHARYRQRYADVADASLASAASNPRMSCSTP